MSRQPNILVFLTDDHARWALPCYGGADFSAPNLDRLAQSGTVMDNAFTPCPVCSPARASFFTGLMPSQHGVRDFISARPAFHQRDWLAGLDTLPEQLAGAGYQCGLSGKWHIGRDETPAPGFEFWSAMSGAYPVTHDGAQEISRNGTVTTHRGYLTDAITDGALEFLATRDRARPFFLFVGYYATHSPWAGQPEDLVQAARALAPASRRGGELPEGYRLLNPELPDALPEEEREAAAQYRAAVAHIDNGVGNILDAIGDDDTIIVYTADHGLSQGQSGVWGKGNATCPLNFFADNVRIPMIVARPGVWPGERRNGALCDQTDLYQTLRQAAEITQPEPDGKTRPGRPIPLGTDATPDPAKSLQVSEYGPAAMACDGTQTLVRRAGGTVEYSSGASHNDTPSDANWLSGAMDGFFADLGCPPPDQWQPPNAKKHNLSEAWRCKEAS